MTFTIEIKRAVLMRDGYLCQMSQTGADVHLANEVNHRLNRGAGGHGDDTISNACAICVICNGLIESDADLARDARRRGVKLLHPADPELVPMWSVFFGQWVLLASDGLRFTGITDRTLSAEGW